MYIEFGPLPKEPRKAQRWQFVVKIGKGKTVVTSPEYSSRATVRAKANKMRDRLAGCDRTLYEWEAPQ